jgi:hypothetical protein
VRHGTGSGAVIILGVRSGALLLACAAALLLGASSASAAPRSCRAVALVGGRVLLLPTLEAVRAPDDSAAFAVRVSGAPCATAYALLASVLAADDETIALGQAGFRVVAVRRGPEFRGREAHDVVAARGRARVEYARFGGRPALDHSLFRAGQWIDVYGDTQLGHCTAAWVLQLRAGGPPVGLTAGHCRERTFTEDLPILRGFAGHPASRLGTYLRGYANGLDAAIFSIVAEVGVAQQVERGDRLPRTAIGWVPTRDQDPGDGVCFAGRSSGADRCGHVIKRFKGTPKYAVCTDIKTEHGDSGGPVYTPGDGATTRAMGIVIVGGGRLTGHRNDMCYTPIEAILGAFDATFARGPLVRAPGYPA